jgi:hypothetical protein
MKDQEIPNGARPKMPSVVIHMLVLGMCSGFDSLRTERITSGITGRGVDSPFAYAYSRSRASRGYAADHLAEGLLSREQYAKPSNQQIHYGEQNIQGGVLWV